MAEVLLSHHARGLKATALMTERVLTFLTRV